MHYRHLTPLLQGAQKNMKDSAWARCLNEFMNDIRYDLEIIAKHGNSPQSYQSFADDSLKNKPAWKKLISDWKLIKAESGYYKIPDYLPLAQLLEELKHYDLSAYFYQVSKGSVPKKVWSASPYYSKPTFLGLTLRQHEIWLAKIIIWLAKIIIWFANIIVKIFIGFVLLTFTLIKWTLYLYVCLIIITNPVLLLVVLIIRFFTSRSQK